MTGPSGSEAHLDTDLVARVLRRASELAKADEDADALNGAGHAIGPGTIGVGVGESALIAAAEEVGLSVAAVRRSIAVERLGPLPVARRSDKLFGASVVAVDDEISATVPDVLDRLDAWMVDGHHLRRERLRDDRTAGHAEWSKRSGLVGIAVRTIRNATGEGKLGEVRRITATAADTGVGTCAVRVTADRTRDRQTFTGGGAAVAATGTAAIVVVAVAATPFVLLATPVAVIAGVGVAVRGRARANRTRREIERVLDAVDQGGDPTRLSIDLARRVAGRTRRRRPIR